MNNMGNMVIGGIGMTMSNVERSATNVDRRSTKISKGNRRFSTFLSEKITKKFTDASAFE